MLNTGTNGVIKSRFIRGVNLVAQQISGTSYYYIFNAHGDVLQRVDNAGNRTKLYEYDAFGNQRDFIETDPNPFRYCCEYYDTETNEIYLRARYYNSANGRFTTEDPAKAKENWYCYCQNNPVIRIDPTGLDSYIIYDDHMYSTVKGKREIEEMVLSLESELESIYDTDVHPIPVSTPEEFEKAYNNLPSNIDSLIIISHSGPNALAFGNNNNLIYKQKAFEVKDFSQLESKNIDFLGLMGCNTNKNNPKFSQNVASSFWGNNNINMMLSSTGNSIPAYLRTPSYSASYGNWVFQTKQNTMNIGYEILQPSTNKTLNIVSLRETIEAPPYPAPITSRTLKGTQAQTIGKNKNTTVYQTPGSNVWLTSNELHWNRFSKRKY